MEIMIPQEVKEKASRAEVVLQQVETFELQTDEDSVELNEIARDVQTKIKDLESVRAELLEPFNEGIKGVRAFFQVHLDKYNRAKATCKQLQRTYLAKKEEDERIERAKVEAAEKARREKELAKLKAKAEKEKERGRVTAAAALTDNAAELARTPIAQPARREAPKLEGSSTRKSWEVTVDVERQEDLLHQAIDAWNAAILAAEKATEKEVPHGRLIDANYWELNVGAIKKQANSMKGRLKLPNVTVEAVSDVVTRKR